MCPIAFVRVRSTRIVDMQSCEWVGFHTPGQLTCCWLPGDMVHMLKRRLTEHRFVGNSEYRAVQGCGRSTSGLGADAAVRSEVERI